MKMRLQNRIALLLLAVLSVRMLSGCGAVQEAAYTENAPENTGLIAEESTTADTEETEKPTDLETTTANQEAESQEDTIMIITVNGTDLTAVMEENSSVSALMALLSDGPLTIEMHDYGDKEKVGSLGTDLPRNDHQTTTEAGDLILYQGNSFVIYYSTNSWNFTRLGKIQNITSEALRELLGDGDVTVTLSLPGQS